MDIVFDIDGTLADASHRLHFIQQPADQLRDHVVPDFEKDWDSFLSDEQVAKDAPIGPIWFILNQHLAQGHNIRFITGRPERQRDTTVDWLLQHIIWIHATYASISGYLYMRRDGDRRPSDVVKREGLLRARADGFDPKLVFEDRKNDTAMWRSEGLLCCQVAEGNY